MAKESLNSLISRMEAAAEQSGAPSTFWHQVALVLQVWRNCRDGWFPVVDFDPRYQPGLRDLQAAYKQFGVALADAANQRAFA